MRALRFVGPVLGVALGVLFVGGGGCGSDGDGSGFTEEDGGSSGSSGSSGASGTSGASGFGSSGNPSEAAPPCVGLECDRVNCGSAPETTVTGIAYDPAGKTPLYNVIVYIPNDKSAPLDPIKTGASCDQCGATIKNAVSTALTNTKGEFTLKNVPVGVDIPLVVQVGKWRRKIVLPKIDKCTENKITDPSKPVDQREPRLPRNKTEGDMPQMAVVTGGCDPMACLFRRIGIDASEFTAPSGNGRMHVYKGVGGGDVTGGGATAPEGNLWNNAANLSKYDILLLSCECDEHNETKSAAQKDLMRDFLNAGGRVFATHYHYTWFSNGPAELKSIANWTPDSLSADPTVADVKIDTTFPKGKALSEWLANVAPGAVKPGDLVNFNELRTDVTTVNAPATSWVTHPTSNKTKYLTFNAPVGKKVEEQCGRGVFSDIHVSGTRNDASTVPSSCQLSDNSPQEKALEFLFFDLSSCVQDDKQPPKPPSGPN